MNMNATLIGQSIAMIVFVLFCMKYVWPPIINALETRRKNIADGLAAANESGQKLEQAEKEAAEMVGSARQQASDIVEQANRRAVQIVEEARNDAMGERERQVQAAQSDIEQEVNRAREELSGKVASLAVAGAEQLLGREINADAHNDLLNKLATEL
ncbi:MAG: F0F1 ATP synthase subunit B [Lysobacterales bacterium]